MPTVPKGGFPYIMAMNQHYPSTIATEDRLRRLAWFDFVALGFWYGQTPGGLSIPAFVASLRRRNPSMVLSQYTIAQEASTTSTSQADIKAKLDAAGWWVTTLNGTTKLKSTYNDPDTYDTNLTDWTTPDGNGQRYPQWLAGRNYAGFFSQSSFDYCFVDNFLSGPSATPADWNRDASNEANTDPTVMTKYRQGQAAYVTAIRSLGQRNVLVNSLNNNDLSSAEYINLCEAAYFEAAIGESWSIETISGWDAMMTRYRAGLTNTAAPHIVGFGVHGTMGDCKTMRYGLTSCLMDNGYFSYVPSDSNGLPAWFDEFDYRLGTAIDSPPGAAWSNGVYKREFQYGLALCNPTGSPQTVTPTGGPWKRIKGQQCSGVNSGAAVTSITIPSRDGILLIPQSIADHTIIMKPRAVRN